MKIFFLICSLGFLLISQTEARVNTPWLKNNGQNIIDVTETLDFIYREPLMKQSAFIENTYKVRIFSILLQSADEETSQDLGKRIIEEVIGSERSLLWLYEEDKDIWSLHYGSEIADLLYPGILQELEKEFIENEKSAGVGEALTISYSHLEGFLRGDILSYLWYDTRLYFTLIALISSLGSGALYGVYKRKRSKKEEYQ